MTDNWHLAPRAQPAVPTARASRRERGVLGLRLKPRGNPPRGLARAILGLTLFVGGVLWANGMVSTGHTASTPVGVAQSFGAVNTIGTSTLTATTAGTTAGDLLVTTVRDRSPTSGLATVTSVTDSAGNHWAKAAGVTEGTQNDGEVWYAASAAGVTTVTVNVSITAALAFTVLDITGATTTPLDKIATNAGVGNKPSVGPTATTSQVSEIVVADIGWNTPLTPSAQTTGYTVTAVEQSTVSNTATGEQAAWQILSATGTPSYAASLPPSSSVAWTGSLATFVVGTSPSPTPTLTPTATPTPTTTPTSTGSIGGQISDGVTSANLVGATASYSGGTSGSVPSGPSGIYLVSGLHPGTYLVSAADTGYNTSQQQSVTVTAGATTKKNFALTPKPGAISGTVIDGQTATPISGATVTYSVRGGQVPMVVISSHSTGQGAVASPGNNYGTLRSIEEAFGLNLLGSAGNAVNGDLSSSFGTATGARHVMVIMEENQGYAATLGACTADPYYCSLASAYASFTHWYGVSHPSLPNYLAIDSGGAQGCSLDSCPGPYSATDLGGQLTAASIPWTAYMESMPSPCYAGALSGTYAKKHNPFVYFTDVLSGACSTNVLPYPGSSAMLSALSGATAPSFVWITPNLTDDMHDGTVQQGDAWLKTNLAPVLSSSWFTGFNSTVIVTMDEHSGDNSGVGDPGTLGGTTNAAGDGTYGFNAVTEGSYTVTASATGYVSQSGTVTIGPGGAATQPFVLAPQPGSISGTVTDSVTGLPIANATVCIGTDATCATFTNTTTTAVNGTYSFSGLTEGSYQVNAVATNYVPQTATGINVTPGATTTKNFALALVPNPGSITGTVKDSVSSTPVSGATVCISTGGTCSGNSTTTALDGTYTLSSITGGSYQVTASAIGYSSLSAPLTVAPGTSTTHDFALTAGPGTITGTVKDSVSSTPISGATVCISTSGTCGGTTTTSASNGTYTFSNVAPGSYQLTASATAYVTQSTITNVVVTTGSTATQDFQLVPNPGSISGTVTDFVTGLPIANATVCTGTDATCATFTNKTTTAVNGTYTMSGLTEGSYQVNVMATTYVSQSANSVSVTPGGTTTKNVALVPLAGAIGGTVTDSVAHTGLFPATVSYTGPGGSSGTTNTTDANGDYTLSLLAEGSYQVTTSAASHTSQTLTVGVTPNATTTQNFALTSAHQPIFSDGFESNSFSAWTSSSGLTVESTAGHVHTGTYAAEGLGSSGDALKLLPSTYTSGYERVWFNIISQTSQIKVLQARTTGTGTSSNIAYIIVNATTGTNAHDLALNVNGTKVATATTAAVLPGSGWHELEMSVAISGTTGSFQVWLDGVEVTALTYSGTLGTTLANPIGQMQIGDTAGSTWDVAFDDAAFDTQFLP